MCAFSAYFLLPVYLTDLGATESLVGAIMSSMGVSNAITLIWIYFWGADHDTRQLMLLGCIATIISCVAILMTTHLFLISAIRLLQGFAFCLYFVSLNTYLTEICPPSQHAKQIGFLGIITLATQSAAPAAAEAFVALTSFPALFGLTVVFSVGATVMVLLLPVSDKKQRLKSTDLSVTSSEQPWLAYGLQISAVALLGGAAYGTALIFSPLYLRAHGILPLPVFYRLCRRRHYCEICGPQLGRQVWPRPGGPDLFYHAGLCHALFGLVDPDGHFCSGFSSIRSGTWVDVSGDRCL